MGEQDQAVVEDVEVHAQEEAGIQVDVASEEVEVVEIMDWAVSFGFLCSGSRVLDKLWDGRFVLVRSRNILWYLGKLRRKVSLG